MHGMKEYRAYVQNQLKMVLPTFFGKSELEPYLEWEGKMEELFKVYDLMEDGNVSGNGLLSCYHYCYWLFDWLLILYCLSIGNFSYYQ